jgi:hypothetical protein
VKAKKDERGTTWARLCKLALSLPEVEEATSYGTPALRVRKKLLARLKEDGQTVALRVDFDDRDVLLQMDESAFFLTDHYRPYPFLLVRLPELPVKMLPRLLEDAWRHSAPKRVAGKALPTSAPRSKRSRRPSGM